jgi:hypothetical protein
MIKACTHKVSDVEFQLSVFDLLVVVDALQRRLGYRVDGHVRDTTEAFLCVAHPPWRECQDVHLRFRPESHAEHFEFFFDLLWTLGKERECGDAVPTSVHLASYESIRPSVEFALKDLGKRDGDVDEWMSHSLRLCLRRSYHGPYMWPQHVWDTFVALMEERREAVWKETHVWPPALAFYHLLTRRGVDAHCAKHDVETLYLAPGRARFA